ncbi:hypothetical protein BC829DRAFT_384537 [Chytridium lagenaria]|nr:hypothetical protein BC829DRAFT_384537 [Chytridium lagenaria]
MLELLPNETIIEILSYLSLDTRITFFKCSKKAKCLTSDGVLWNRLVLQSFSVSARNSLTHVYNVVFEYILPDGGYGLSTFIASGLGELFSDKHLMQVARSCPNLVELDVSSTSVTDKGVQYVFGLSDKKLERKNIYDPYFASQTEPSTPPLAPPPPPAAVWDPIFTESGVTDRSASVIAESCKFLTHVDLSSILATGISDNGVCALLQTMCSLTSLSLSGCTAVSDRVPETIVSSPCLKTLRLLDLSGCFNVTSVGIRKLFYKCENLESLDLGFCWRVDDDVFRTPLDDGIIQPQCLNMRTLRLAYCYSISDIAMAIVMKIPTMDCF